MSSCINNDTRDRSLHHRPAAGIPSRQPAILSMRLLFVHERLGSFAGAEVNLLATAGELLHRGHRLALLHGPGTGRGEEAWRDVFNTRFPLGDAPGGAGVLSAVRDFRPDLVYVHKLSEIDALSVLSKGPAPVVRMVHDHGLFCMRGYKYHYLTRHICTRATSPLCVFPCGASLGRSPGSRFGVRWISYLAKRHELAINRRFQRLVVASAYMRSELVRNGFLPERIETHPPVPRAIAGETQGSFSERNLIVYAGQIVRGKGVDVLLEALSLVREPFEAVIAGDGSHRPACERRCRELGLENRVHFLGYLPQERIVDLYRDASIAVLSSVWPEPFGAVGLEAMRCGLPVVAFDAGGIGEWLLDGVNGFLVPWMDRGIFADRIQELLKNKSLARQLGRHGRDLADRRFDFGRYVDGLEGMFSRVEARR